MGNFKGHSQRKGPHCNFRHVLSSSYFKKIIEFIIINKGLCSGNVEIDAAPLRMFAQENINIILIHSFAKNFFLYGHRIGCLSFVCPNENIANNIMSQLKHLIRRSYSNPPSYGANLVDTILNDEHLLTIWKTVRERKFF